MTKDSLIARVNITQAPSLIERRFDLDLSKMVWHADGTLGRNGLTQVSRDLLELARLIWEVEKHTPKRISSQRTRTVDVTLTLRDTSVWSNDAMAALQDILRLLGNAEWRFKLGSRTKKAETSLDALAVRWKDDGGQPATHEVALFSGGLDSTSGLAWLSRRKRNVAIASFYGAKTKQAKIRDALAFNKHFQMTCQWTGAKTRFGGQFQYRSFLFLNLGAAVAASYGAKTLYQFENGPLAIGLPPSPNYRMTRHAHPKLHTIASRFFSAIHGRPITISNPFLLTTKREAAKILREQSASAKTLEGILENTETCWNLNSRSIVGSISKDIGQACGLCIPCLVRRTALNKDPVSHRIDFTNRKDPKFADLPARVHLDAYLLWSHKMLHRDYLLEHFAFDLPRVVHEALQHTDGELTHRTLFDLYRRFAAELLDTFPEPKTRRG